jgi:glycosyltransferase involved in cell wall biosynthesis
VRLCLQVFSASDGGVPETVLQQALGLRERGWDCWLAGPEQASIYAWVGAGMPIVRLPFRPGYRHAVEDARVLHGLIRLMRRRRFDLVHARSNKGGVFGRLAALATGIPIVYNPGGWTFDPAFRTGVARGFALGIERLLAPCTSAFICVSESERRVALDYGIGPASSLNVLLNAAAACDNTLEPDQALERFAREGPLAACITVLRPEKGVDVFLKAAVRVFNRLPEARLAVVGNGPLRPDLQRDARAMGLDDRLRFFEYRWPSARQLRSIDVFVLPTRYEPFGIGLVEAMACGVPQVTTGVGGTSEIVRNGETGLFCRPDDPDDLAEQIVRLLSDAQLRARMSDRSLERYRQSFTLERMLDETAALFDRVVEEGRARAR